MTTQGEMTDNGYFVRRLFLKHASLNTAAQLISVIGPIMGGIMAGRYFGGDGLTVTAVFSPMFFLAGFLGTVISGGASVVAAEYLAKDDTDGIHSLYSISVLLSVAAGSLVCAAMLIFKNSIMLHLYNNTPDKTFELYYIYTAFYTFFTVLSHLPLYWSRFIGKPYIGLFMTASLTILNIAFNLMNIEIFKLKTEGVALGQAAASACAYLASMVLLTREKNTPAFTAPANVLHNARRICVAGSFMGLSKLYRFLLGIIINSLLINVYNGTAVAVYGILNIFQRFFSAFSTGITSAVIPPACVFNEEKDAASIRQVMKTAILFSVFVSAATGMFLLLCDAQIAAVFGLRAEDSIVFSHASFFFVLYIFPFFILNIFSAYYAAIKRISLANIITFLFDIGFMLSFFMILKGFAGIEFIWSYIPASAAATIVFSIPLVALIKRQGKDLSYPFLSDLGPEKNGRYLSFSVDNDISRACEAADKITDFCKANGLSQKRTMLISLSVEEMIVMIINNTKAAYNAISVRIIIQEDNSVILRIRNMGKRFNAVEYYKKTLTGDIENDLDIIGMKYIVENSLSVYYKETFGINNLIIVL